MTTVHRQHKLLERQQRPSMGQAKWTVCSRDIYNDMFQRIYPTQKCAHVLFCLLVNGPVYLSMRGPSATTLHKPCMPLNRKHLITAPQSDRSIHPGTPPRASAPPTAQRRAPAPRAAQHWPEPGPGCLGTMTAASCAGRAQGSGESLGRLYERMSAAESSGLVIRIVRA